MKSELRSCERNPEVFSVTKLHLYIKRVSKGIFSDIRQMDSTEIPKAYLLLTVGLKMKKHGLGFLHPLGRVLESAGMLQSSPIW